MTDDDLVSVRYMVADVEESIYFYTRYFGFVLRNNFAPAFADVVRGKLRLLLAGPESSAGRPMPDGQQPVSGGWNRIHLIVEDIATEVDRLRAAGVRFRNEIVSGPGGLQILVDDPSGNPPRALPAGGESARDLSGLQEQDSLVYIEDCEGCTWWSRRASAALLRRSASSLAFC